LQFGKKWSRNGVEMEENTMAEVRLQLPDDLVSAMQEKLSMNVKPTEIAKDAIALYNWAVSERAKGNVILSSNNDGTNLTRVTMPSLDSIKP
jgi:hypothetical protein